MSWDANISKTVIIDIALSLCDVWCWWQLLKQFCEKPHGLTSWKYWGNSQIIHLCHLIDNIGIQELIFSTIIEKEI